MPIDRNRGSGRVPGSPWNLSIRPTRSPPPAYRLTASSLSSAFPFHCLEYCPFPHSLALSILYRVSSPFLLSLHKYPFNFFTISPFSFFLISVLFFFYVSVSLFSPLSLRIDLPISFRTSSKDFFFLTDRHAADLPSGWLAKNRGDSKVSFICLNPGIRSGNSPRENPAFFNKIPRKRQWNVRLCRWQMSALLRTFFDGLMITEGLLDHTRESLLFFLPYFIDDFLIFA